MSRVEFLSDERGLYGFHVSGHSSFDCDDEEGKTVCAAVSSACYMAANTISEIIGDRCEATVDDGEMRVTVPNGTEMSRTVLAGLRLHLTELSKQYSKRITIIYGGVDHVKD